MPVFDYQREDGKIVEMFVWPNEQADEMVCEDGVKAKRIFSPPRRIRPKATVKHGGWPMVSTNAGIHPEQIPDALSRFPDHEYTPDGDMVFESAAHRKKCLRDIGMVDLDGNDSASHDKVRWF